MRCPKCGRAYACQLFSSVLCIHSGCSNYDMDWYFDVMGKSDENGWVNIPRLSDEVWELRDKVCGYLHWYPKYKFLADPIKQSVNGEDWVWAVNTKLITMYGIQISCPLSPPAPHSFRGKLANQAKKCIETLRKGFNAEPFAKWGTKENPRRGLSFTKVTQRKKFSYFNTEYLMGLLVIRPTKVFLADDATFCAARPGKVAITQGYRPGELSKSYEKYINAEIKLG